MSAATTNALARDTGSIDVQPEAKTAAAEEPAAEATASNTTAASTGGSKCIRKQWFLARGATRVVGAADYAAAEAALRLA